MNYWILEYSKVMIAYLMVMYLWPTVVFRKHLRKKSKTYRFAFCSVVSVLLYYTVIIFLGLAHILHNAVVFLLFYGVFFVQLFREYRFSKEVKDHFRYVVTGTMKPKSYILDLLGHISSFLKNWLQDRWKSLNGIKGECFLLVPILIYGMCFFSYGTLHMNSFGFSDLYVHHSWVYGLRIGRIFYRGIYPEAMHCFMYLISVVFPIRTYTLVMYVGPVHVLTILISIFLYFRELFRWKYSPHLALLLFLIVEFPYTNNAVSYARLQTSLPQEFSFGGMFLIPVFLLRYLNCQKQKRLRRPRIRIYADINLAMFIAALSETIVVHFYGTIMAFYLCLPIAVIFAFKVFHYKRFLPLFASVLISLVITIVPMALAFAEGIPLQGSIGWGLNVIHGSAAVVQGSVLSAGNEWLNTMRIIAANSRTSLISAVDGTLSAADPFTLWLRSRFAFYWDVIKNAGYYSIFTGLSNPIRIATFVGALIGVLFRCLLSVRNRIMRRTAGNEGIYDGYLVLASTAFFYVFAFVSSLIGVPELVARSRLLCVIQLLNLSVFVIPVDFILSLPQNRRSFFSAVNFALGTGCAAVCIYVVLRLNLYHSNQYLEMTRYNAEADVTEQIVTEFPHRHFTVISTTDELYQVNEYGYHEEILDFLWKNERDEHYTIPTPYLFVYVEKNSIRRSQYHGFSAPDWLADNTKSSPLSFVEGYSIDPDVTSQRISQEFAEMELPPKHYASKAAQKPEMRATMNSRMFEWVQKFSSLHPHSISVYYEDDDFVCYMIEQNPARLFELAIN